MLSDFEKLCEEKGLKMTEQRRIIARVIENAKGHPDVEQIHKQSSRKDKNISIATVYRTVRLFKDIGIIEEHNFGDGRARYEEASKEHHDHLIDLKNGEVIEFVDKEIEKLQEKVAKKLGYKLVDHKLELYAVPINQN